MNEKIVNLDDFKKEERRRKLIERKDKVVEFISKNAELVAVTIPLVIGGSAKVAHTFNKAMERKEKNDRRKQIYDRSTGTYVKLKHQLTSKEYKELLNRQDNGEKTLKILSDMGLIK